MNNARIISRPETSYSYASTEIHTEGRVYVLSRGKLKRYNGAYHAEVSNQAEKSKVLELLG